MPRKIAVPPLIEEREFRTVEEIDSAISKLERRIKELNDLNLEQAIRTKNGADNVIASNVRTTIREIFGMNSPTFKEHQYLSMWAGTHMMNSGPGGVLRNKRTGRVQMEGVLKNLIARLQEKRAELSGGTGSAPLTSIDRLNLHPRILEVSRDRFVDGYPWDAVFAASKALVNYVKERSGLHDLDGAPLMRTAFSVNKPVLALNDLSDQTDRDEQEGTMHLFEGAVLAIRNPGGHSFPEGSDQRAVEYLSLLSLLAYRVQEAKLKRP